MDEGEVAVLIHRCVARKHSSVPLVGFSVVAGFPSPAEDYLDRPLDFNELLIVRTAATFAVRVSGDSMRDAGILPNDIAVIDRSITPVSGCIILAVIDNEFTIKTYRKRGARLSLEPANPAYRRIEITEGMTFECWGVVKGVVRVL